MIRSTTCREALASWANRAQALRKPRKVVYELGEEEEEEGPTASPATAAAAAYTNCKRSLSALKEEGGEEGRFFGPLGARQRKRRKLD